MIRKLKQEKLEVPIIMITGDTSVRTDVDAMKKGAYDLPGSFQPGILCIVREAINKYRRKSGNRPVENKVKKETENERVIEKGQVFAVLTRTSRDKVFWMELYDKGSEALRCFKLSDEAMAAIISGDIDWIRKNYEWSENELTEDKLAYMRCVLEVERW